jgi:hypothetical protein
MYDLRHLGITTDKIQIPGTNPLAAVQYSCVHWVDHLLDAHRICEDAGTLIDAFLRDKYLYWLEALGLLGYVAEGVRAMEKLVEFVVSCSLLQCQFYHDQGSEKIATDRVINRLASN